MEMFPLLAFFQARLFDRAWPLAVVTELTADTAPTPIPPKGFIIFPDDPETDGRARWPVARELTAAITFWASGPS